MAKHQAEKHPGRWAMTIFLRGVFPGVPVRVGGLCSQAVILLSTGCMDLFHRQIQFSPSEKMNFAGICDDGPKTLELFIHVRKLIRAAPVGTDVA